MKRHLAIAALACVVAMPAWQAAHAQTPAQALASNVPAAHRHASGLALEDRGDDRGAFNAFLDAAENGYPPAQLKLGEIYDSGNSVVERDYAESIRWFQRARDGGEQIPPPKSPMPILNSP